MELGEASSEPRHPIQVVARRTGLTADVIRVWERRYHAVSPRRSPTNRRLYSDADVERLLLLRRATLLGRRIGDVAGLGSTELESLVEADEAAVHRAPTAAETPPSAAAGGACTALEECLRAVEALDAEGLGLALSRSAVHLAPASVIKDVLDPLLREIGDRWRAGTLMAAHEHLTTAVVRSFLGTVSGSRLAGGPESPALVVTTPAGQQHELGALMVAAMAALDGWKATYLGPDLPAVDIAAAAVRCKAGVVALSLLYPADDPRLPDELRRLRQLLPDDVHLFVGGSAAKSYHTVLDELGARCRTDLDVLRRDLESLRAGSG